MALMFSPSVIDAIISNLSSLVYSQNEVGLMHQIVETICECGGFHHVSIYLIDSAREWCVIRAATGEVGKMMLRQGRKYPIGVTSHTIGVTSHMISHIGQAILSGKMCLLRLQKDDIYYHSPLLPYTRWKLAVPLHTQGEVVGVLELRGDKEVDFSLEDARPFKQVADKVSSKLRLGYSLR